MSLRETILIGVLVALGVVGFQRETERDRQHLEQLLQRERELEAETSALRDRGRALRRQGDALESDRYYVERVARAELGWRPSPARDPILPPNAPVPTPAPSMMAQNLPDSTRPLLPQVNPPAPPPAPPPPAQPPGQPPAQPPAPPAGGDALVLLGYDSIEHFQRKMMSGNASGALDDATVARARKLVELLRRLGFDSVKAFQQRNGLAADGVLGRRTEQRALDLLRRKRPGRAGSSYLADNGKHKRGGG